MTANVLASALAFARRGFAVVPLNWPTSEGRLRCSCGKSQCPAPAKHPHGKLAPRGLLSATTEPGILKHWFAVSAPQANLGVVTNKLVVLDVDPRHDGDASLRNLERNHQPLPLTWRALTGGGGEHVIFQLPRRRERQFFASARRRCARPRNRRACSWRLRHCTAVAACLRPQLLLVSRSSPSRCAVG